jgi:transposase
MLKRPESHPAGSSSKRSVRCAYGSRGMINVTTRPNIALEATGNTHAIVRLLEGHVARVVVSNPQQTRAIAESKIKTDKVDA